ncbi:MAG: DoxX family protein [Methyloligellaceae bacterium]
MSFISSTVNLHNRVFSGVQSLTQGWFPGLFARISFSSVLLYYFWNSACTKVEGGCFQLGMFLIPNSIEASSGSYSQIIPPIAEHYGYDASAIPFYWKTIVYMGTFAEFILPLMLLLGLFTRLSSLALVGFIAVMTFVDINFHGADAQTIGAFFDKVHDSAISDQRVLWLMPLIALIITGPGKVSLDYLLGRFFPSK